MRKGPMVVAVVLLLLGSVITAFGECAWVLWEHVSGVGTCRAGG
jgi:hypothetical protein